MPRRFSVFLLLVALSAACRTGAPSAPVPPAPPASAAPPASSAPAAAEPRPDDRLHALLWFQTSAEYRILAKNVYAQAKAALDRALADPAWTAVEAEGNFAGLPPAVIVDVDETVLDNSPYEAESVRLARQYEPVSWKAWIDKAAARAIPGAVDFARYAVSRGVTIFYVSNRVAQLEDPTRANLVAVGFPVTEGIDTVLLPGEKPDWVSDKTSRRAHVAATHRVLLLIGDDLNDFTTGARTLPEERIAVAERHAARWGVSWFLLPNPDYGSWEAALSGHEKGLSEAEARRRKLEWLRLPE
jgi:acid phosphatase